MYEMGKIEKNTEEVGFLSPVQNLFSDVWTETDISLKITEPNQPNWYKLSRENSSLRSKRFRGVGEQRKTKELARAKLGREPK